MNQYEQSTPSKELKSRIAGLQIRLEKNNADGALILQKADLFYYAGTTQQGWLFVPVLGDPVLMIFKNFERAKQESGFEKTVSIISPKQIPETISEYGYSVLSTIGLELDVLTANQFLQFQSIFSHVNIIDISTEIRLQRAVKSEHEIELIRKTSTLADKVASKVPDLIKEGMSEIEFAGQLEAYARKIGHQGLIRMRMWDNDLFYGHIMSGADAAIPSAFSSPTGGRGANPSIAQGPGLNVIKKNEPVLVDYVFVFNGYLSDHTRIFSIGTVSDELRHAHDAMLDIQAHIKKEAVPGRITGDLYDEMVSMARGKGYEDYFMGADEKRIRFTGHGLGIELDEFPFIAKGQQLALEKGMIIALEPKLVIPGKGVVGIENTFLVTVNGLEPLTTYDDKLQIL